MTNEFSMCPKCGSKKIKFVQGKKWLCPDCGMDLYCNVAAAAGLVICSSDGRVLFETRAKEPRKGFLALPGGFINADESAEDAVKRECREEIGVQIESVKYLGSFPNTYEYKDFVYKTCDLFFESSVSNEAMDGICKKINADKSEVEGVCLKKIRSQSDLDSLPLAFDSARKILSLWLGQKNQEN